MTGNVDVEGKESNKVRFQAGVIDKYGPFVDLEGQDGLPRVELYVSDEQGEVGLGLSDDGSTRRAELGLDQKPGCISTMKRGRTYTRCRETRCTGT
jgi:hypothetical protein